MQQCVSYFTTFLCLFLFKHLKSSIPHDNFVKDETIMIHFSNCIHFHFDFPFFTTPHTNTLSHIHHAFSDQSTWEVITKKLSLSSNQAGEGFCLLLCLNVSKLDFKAGLHKVTGQQN